MPSTMTDLIGSVSTSVAIKAPVKAVATANITLSGEQTINGVACVTGDRVLVTAQTSAVDNGIYVVSTAAWSRSQDFDGNRDVVPGTIVIGPTDGGTGNWLEDPDAEQVGQALYPLSAAEIAAGLTANDITFQFPYGDIRRYGAVDGADSTAAIQAACDVSSIVKVPCGTFFAGTLTLTAKTRIQGEEWTTSIIKLKNATNDDLFVIETAAGYVEFENVTLDGNKANQTTGYCIELPAAGSYSSGVYLNRARLVNGKSGGLYAGTNRNLGRIMCSDITDHDGTGLYILGTDWNVDNSDIGRCGVDCIYNNQSTNTYTNNDIFNAGRYGVYAYGLTKTLHLIGNVFNNHADAAVYLIATGGGDVNRSILIIGNKFFNNSYATTGTTPDIYVAMHSGISIVGNAFFTDLNYHVPTYHVQVTASLTEPIPFLGNVYQTTASGTRYKSYATGLCNDMKMLTVIDQYNYQVPMFETHIGATSGSFVDQGFVDGEAYARYQQKITGEFLLGDGSGVTDVQVARRAANVWGLGSGDGLAVGNTVANTNSPSGATARAWPIYSETGTLLGYVPVYTAQW